MNTLRSSCVFLMLSQFLMTANANVKITPIAVDNKSNLKSDLKVEEARYQNPIMPEYYDRSSSYYDRNRQNFVTGGSYGNSLSNYDRYGYNSNGASGYGGSSAYGANNYGSNNYGSYGGTKSKKIPRYLNGNLIHVLLDYGSLGTMLENKLNYMSGGSYNPSYGNRYPYDNNPMNVPPYPPPHGGLLPPELEAKSGLLLPLAGAALLGLC